MVIPSLDQIHLVRIEILRRQRVSRGGKCMARFLGDWSALGTEKDAVSGER